MVIFSHLTKYPEDLFFKTTTWKKNMSEIYKSGAIFPSCESDRLNTWFLPNGTLFFSFILSSELSQTEHELF